MSKRRYNWTQKQLDRMAELVEAGVPHHKIAEEMEATTGAVDWQLLRMGVTGPRSTKFSQNGGSYLRHGRVVRRFSSEEDKVLLELEAEGLGPYKIGCRIGRSHNSVMGRLATLARHDQLEEEAEKRALNSK